MKNLRLTLAILAVGLVLAAGPASAQTTICTGTLAAGTYTNVNVPRNASCTIGSPVTITGNVIAASGASLMTATGLVTPPGVHISGNVVSEDALTVTLAAVTVGGNVALQGTVGEVEVVATSISGNLQISGTSAGPIFAESNTVTGSVVVDNNATAGALSNRIDDNTIGGNLVCMSNTPPPTDIVVIPPPTPRPNAVGGNKVGQCAGL